MLGMMRKLGSTTQQSSGATVGYDRGFRWVDPCNVRCDLEVRAQEIV